MKTNSIKAFSLKGILTKVVVTGALAAAVFMAAPQKAEAQGFRVGIQFGHPGYYAPVAPVVYGPAYGYREDYYARERRLEFERHQEWLRHERFDRGYGHRFYYGR